LCILQFNIYNSKLQESQTVLHFVSCVTRSIGGAIKNSSRIKCLETQVSTANDEIERLLKANSDLKASLIEECKFEEAHEENVDLRSQLEEKDKEITDLIIQL